MDNLNRILVGMANASPNYGIQPRGKLTSQILQDIWRTGIKRVDSAKDYEFAEEVILETGLNWQIQTKFKLPEVYESFEDLLQAARIATSNIQVQRLLIHTPNLYRISRANQVVQDLKRISEILEIPEVGISIYRPEELVNLESWQNLDVVQFPHNPLDSNCLDWLVANREGRLPKLQARSIYLQGLLVQENPDGEYLPGQLSDIISGWRKWTFELNINPQIYCAAFVFGNLDIDEIVVGVDSVEQLQQMIFNVAGVKDMPRYPRVIPEELTDPRRWTN